MSDGANQHAAIYAAREALQSVDRDELDEDSAGYIWNALEQLDELVVNLDHESLAALGEATDLEEVFGSVEPRETPEDVLRERKADADVEDAVPVTIELVKPMLEMIDVVRDDDSGETTTEWIKQAVRAGLVDQDHEYWNSATIPIEVDLPPEVARWAELWTQYFEATGTPPYDHESRLMDYVNFEFTWRVDTGDEIDLPGDDGGES